MLNNSTQALSFGIGGQVAANPNFNGRSARLILNEVTGALRSNLNGPLAVLGDSARVIIANPNGITCNGCGFVNTSHVTLTTGTPQFLTAPGGTATSFDAATALAFQVRGGQIEITGQGFASPIDRLDLIAETLKASGSTTIPGALNLLAGRQTIDLETLAVLATDATNNKTAIGTDLAIDASLLGAMNAGQIKIISTATGMGVRTDATLAASAGDLVISSAGDLTLRQASASHDVSASASTNFTNTRQLVAGRNITLSAGTLDNRAAQILAGADASLSVGTLNNTGGAIQAQGNLSVALPGHGIDLGAPSFGLIAGGTGLSIGAQNISNSSSFSHAAVVTLNATDSISNSGTLLSGNDLTLNVSNPAGSITNSGTLLALGRMTLNSASATQSGLIESGDLLTLALTNFTNQGDVISHSDLSAVIQTLSNSGNILADYDAGFNLGSAFSNSGVLAAGQDLTLTTAKTSSLGGTIAAGRDLNLNFGDYTHGPGETSFSMGRDLNISSVNFTNQDTLAAARDLSLIASNSLYNKGALLASRDMILSAPTLTNLESIIETGRDFSASASAFSNLGYSSSAIIWLSAYWAGDTWWVSNQQVTGGQPASIAAGRHMAIQANTVDNYAATLTAGGNLSINSQNYFKNESLILYASHVHYSGGSADVQYNSVLTTYPAVVQAAGALNIIAPVITNTGTLMGNSVYLGGNLTNGLTNYNYQTPASTLPSSVIDLSSANGVAAMLAAARFTPNGPYYFQSVSQLALLAPIGGSALQNLLPPELRGHGLTFLMDPWLEQQALRQSAVAETGRALFLGGLSYDEESGMSTDTQQKLLLYQAAARFATANGIQLGVALTPAQIANLSEPILWYVEQEVLAPNGQTVKALVPRLYFPAGYASQMANLAGGVIRGNDVTLDAPDTIDNTGYILASGKLDINAREFTNRKRNADIGMHLEAVTGGSYYTWGDTVQPGGFISAAQIQINADKITSISGEFYAGGNEVSKQLAAVMGDKFVQTQAVDNLQHRFEASKKDDGFGTLAIMAVAIVVSIYTAGAASGAIAAAAESSAVAAGTVVAGTSAATAVGTAAASSAWGMAMSSAAGAMASNLVTGAMTGNLSLDSLLMAGVTAGLTAGLTNAALFQGADGSMQSLNQMAGVQTTGSNLVSGHFNADTFTRNLVGMAGRGVVNAGVSSAVYGSDFKDGLANSLVSDLSAVGANAVGKLAPEYSFGNVAGHALVGGAAAALRGQDAASGAFGAAASALLAPQIDKLSSNDDAQLRSMELTAATMLTGGIIANAIGLDGVTAASAAQNEVTNNYLTASQKSKMFAEIQEKCGSGGLLCKAGIQAKYGVVSGVQDVRLATGAADGIAKRLADTGFEVTKGLLTTVNDIPGTYSKLKDFMANLSSDQIEQMGADTVASYKARLDSFDKNYQTGGWQGSHEAGVEFGGLLVDVAMLAGGVGAAAKFTSQVGVALVEKAGVGAARVGVNSAGAVDGTANIARADSSRPAWLARLDAGNAFNAERSTAYPFNEVYIESPKGAGYTRLDSYNPSAGEIVSRKFTQLSDVQGQTALNYINEIPAKYPVNGTIANVPSSGELVGARLRGQYILEVPVQVNPVPQSVLDAANRSGVL